MQKDQIVMGDTLAQEIQRKTAEIDNWPSWAKPYEARRGANQVGDEGSAGPQPEEGSNTEPSTKRHQRASRAR